MDTFLLAAILSVLLIDLRQHCAGREGATELRDEYDPVRDPERFIEEIANQSVLRLLEEVRRSQSVPAWLDRPLD